MDPLGFPVGPKGQSELSSAQCNSPFSSVRLMHIARHCFPMVPNMRKSTGFDFMAWCSSATLSAKTRKLLADNGLREKDTLSLLTPQDVNTPQLPLAQLILFRQALLRLGNQRFSELAQDSNQTNNARLTPSRTASPVRSPGRQLTHWSTPLLTAGKAFNSYFELKTFYPLYILC